MTGSSVRDSCVMRKDVFISTDVFISCHEILVVVFFFSEGVSIAQHLLIFYQSELQAAS